MASYTTQLRTLVEQATQFEEGLSINEKIEKGRKNIFDFDYPFYNENARDQFERNFIRNFYMREIGFETESLFKLMLENWLNINMPYYNKLFESEQIKYDPLINTYMTTKRNTELDRDRIEDRKTNQKSKTDGVSKGDLTQDTTSKSDRKDDNFSRKVESDTPDSRLQLQTQQGKGVIEYASNIEEVKTDDSRSTTGETKSKTNSSDTSNVESEAHQDDNIITTLDEAEKFLETRRGKVGTESLAKLVTDYRSTLLRIERDIFKEMNELFMLVY